MTNQHPLTDKICEQIRDSIKLRRDEQGHILSYDGQRILDGMFEELFEISNAEMRTAYDKGRDDQLEKVMKWIDKHLTTYINAACCREWEHINYLEDHLK